MKNIYHGSKDWQKGSDKIEIDRNEETRYTASKIYMNVYKNMTRRISFETHNYLLKSFFSVRDRNAK